MEYDLDSTTPGTYNVGGGTVVVDDMTDTITVTNVNVKTSSTFTDGTLIHFSNAGSVNPYQIVFIGKNYFTVDSYKTDSTIIAMKPGNYATICGSGSVSITVEGHSGVTGGICGMYIYNTVTFDGTDGLTVDIHIKENSTSNYVAGIDNTGGSDGFNVVNGAKLTITIDDQTLTGSDNTAYGIMSYCSTKITDSTVVIKVGACLRSYGAMFECDTMSGGSLCFECDASLPESQAYAFRLFDHSPSTIENYESVIGIDAEGTEHPIDDPDLTSLSETYPIIYMDYTPPVDPVAGGGMDPIIYVIAGIGIATVVGVIAMIGINPKY